MIAIFSYLLLLSFEQSQASSLTPPVTAWIKEKGYPIDVWIFFTPKEPKKRILEHVHNNLEPKTLARRRIRASTTVDAHDIPLVPSHVQSLRDLQIPVRVESAWMNAVSASIPSQQKLDEALSLDWVERIELIGKGKTKHITEPDLSKRAKLADTMTQCEKQLELVGATQLRERGYDGQGITVAVFDSGFDLKHKAFKQLNITKTYDFVNENVELEFSHGTATLSLIGGHEPGAFRGVAPAAHFLLGKTEALDYEEPREEDFFVAGLEWAEKNGADLVSSSLGYHSWWQWPQFDGNHSVASRAVEIAYLKGLPVVVSVGNYDFQYLATPGDSKGALSVGATNQDNAVAGYSSRGPTYDGRIKPDIAALGTAVLCADTVTQGYTTKSGTSFSAPLAAGVVALLLQAQPQWSLSQLIQSIKATASRAQNPNIDLGWGIINGSKAATYSPDSCEVACINGKCTEAKVCKCQPGFYGEYCNYKPLECQVWCNNFQGRCLHDICYCVHKQPSKHCTQYIPTHPKECHISLYNDTQTCNFCTNFVDPDCKGFLESECSENNLPIPIRLLNDRCKKPFYDDSELSIYYNFLVVVPGLCFIFLLWNVISKGAIITSSFEPTTTNV